MVRSPYRLRTGKEKIMGMYFEGYEKAREAILAMNEEELLQYLDAMFGRKNLPDDCTIEDIRYEALEQCRRDFTDTSSDEYQLVDFCKRLNAAMKKG